MVLSFLQHTFFGVKDGSKPGAHPHTILLTAHVGCGLVALPVFCQVVECALSMLAALADEIGNMDTARRAALAAATTAQWGEVASMVQQLIPTQLAAGVVLAWQLRGRWGGTFTVRALDESQLNTDVECWEPSRILARWL